MAEATGLKKIIRYDGRLHIFQRPLTPFVWCGFHHKGRYIRTSTKETNFAAATAVAEKWYTLQQAKILTGDASIGGRSFSTAAKSAIKALDERVRRGERSESYAKGIKLLLQTNLIPYFSSTSVDGINVVAWEKYKTHCYEKNPNLSRGTLHQHKSAIRTVLNESYRHGWIKSLPVLKDVYDTDKIKTPRQWFEKNEYNKLHASIRSHKKTLKGTRWEADADELYDYVIFVANSGLRTGEAKNVRFCDVSFHREHVDGQDRKYLMIKNISGKRGTGDCRTMDGAVAAFERRCGKRKIAKPETSEERLFLAYHRDMFNTILDKTGLRWSKERPARKRDLTVLRHTYICFRLVAGASIFEVAMNCRTSPQMISEHYARWISPRILENLNVVKRKQPLNEKDISNRGQLR
jgi:integrase